MSKSKSVATRNTNTAVSQQVDYGQYSSAGTESISADDVVIPFLSILQGLSPEVTGAKPEKKIKGASPGQFCHSLSQELIDGEEGFYFVPCAIRKEVLQWKLREEGGGIVARYPWDAEHPYLREVGFNPDKVFGGFDVKHPEHGNTSLVPSVYVVGIICEDAECTQYKDFVTLPFKSTNMTPFKKELATPIKLYAPKGAPLFAHRFHITTVSETRPKGTSFNYRIRPALAEGSLITDLEHPILAAGHKLYLSFQSGERIIAEEEAPVDAEYEEINQDEVFSGE